MSDAKVISIESELLAVMDLGGGARNHFRVLGNPDSAGGCFLGGDYEENHSRARRSVECWNAFRGVADPEAEMRRLRAIERAVSKVHNLGEGVASLLPEHVDTMRIPDLSGLLQGSNWIVVDKCDDPTLVLTPTETWALYPDGDAALFHDADHALDLAAKHGADVLRVVSVGR